MKEVPSLFSLCIEAVKCELLHEDDFAPAVNEFCKTCTMWSVLSSLFDMLIPKLPPLALQRLQMAMSFDDWTDDQYANGDFRIGRKRGRHLNFDTAWRELFKLRWTENVDVIQPVDWQQMYWETHLQNCLDAAAEIALLPSFDECLGDIKMPGSIMRQIGLGDLLNNAICSYLKLSYHCQQFGQYARCLKLQNVLCHEEVSHLLRMSRLQHLVVRWIRSKEHVDGVCKLLSWNKEILESVEFVHCKFSSESIHEICESLLIKCVTHGIKNFSINSSSFLGTDSISLPLELALFLSSGRSLCSLKLSFNHFGCQFARVILDALLDASSSLSILDLSENNIRGWLFDFNHRTSSSSLTSKLCKSLPSLCVLNLRGNNLHKEDIASLRYALAHMPNLEVLDISDNPIEDAGVRSLMPYVIEASDNFSELNLENCELSCHGVTILVNTLLNLRRPLKSLSIADNILGSRVAAALGKLFCTSIQKLNISEIGLDLSGFQTLRETILDEFQKIKQDIKLVEINISKNRGGIEAAKLLSLLMELAPELVSVNAAYNFMPVGSTPIICSALKAARGKLQLLDLRGNSWNCQPDHASMLAEMQYTGTSVLKLSSSPTRNVPHDDDP